MRMLVTIEFADAGAKSGQHRVLIIGRNGSAVVHGDIGLSLDDAQTLPERVNDFGTTGFMSLESNRW